MILIFLVFQITYETCTQLNYQDCMLKTQNDSCIYSKESYKCFASNQDYLGCVTNINRNLCLLQNTNFKCQYIDKCRNIEQSTLEKIGCEWRELNKKACVSITSDRCIWVQEELKCKQHLSSPSAEERCETQYNDKGQFMIVSPLQCSQIQIKACIWNPSNFICTSEIPKDSRCEDLGISKLACTQLQTKGQNCIYSKQNNFCRDDQECSMVCQKNFVDKCDQNMNQNACLAVQSEACQFFDGVCQKIIPAQCKNQLVNAKTCSEVVSEICIYDTKSLSCETPSLILQSCDSQGINKLACIQLSNQCIFDTKCRTIDPSELLFIQCTDAVSRSTCLSVKTEFQNCQWNADLMKCQEIQITKQTSCTSLKSVNGNSCKAVIKDSCKYQKENCVSADAQDSCDANFINIIGCTSILKFQTACRWLNNQCQKISIHADQTCESLSLVNPVACSLYFKKLADESFSCIMNDSFKWFDYTCRYDSHIMGCRSLLKQEASTLICGDKNLGLNSYACSLITTPGQVCIFRSSQCIASNPFEQYQIQCGVIKFGNPSSCSYTIFGNQPCKFNLNTCECIQSIDPNNDGCQTHGANAIACSMIKKEQCYYETKTYFECKSKLNPEQSNQISCVENFPNKELCLAILKPGEKCEWSIIDQKCKNKQVDPGQPCSYYNQVNQNVCTYIQQIEPNLNNKGYCYYDPMNRICKSWEIGRKCSQSCCVDQIGINTHVCSAMTNTDNSFCYFKDQKCQKYEITNQLDFERISVIFGDDDQCEQFNYQMCGLINPSLEKLYYCFQANSADRCHTLLPNVYKQMDKKLLIADNIRSNQWTCTNINQADVRVRYDQNVGRCINLPITQTIRCEEFLVNKQACLELTRASTCYWDEINFRCKEINFNIITCQSIINKNSCLNLASCRFNNILLQCEDLQTINSSVKCSSLQKDYSYNSNACKQVTDGTSCAYDSINQSCKLQTEIVSDCFLFGQNRQSCLSNTQGLCKWDNSQQLCIAATINSEDQCDSDLNKYSCMKITSKKCSFDTQCNTITQIFTCDQLVEQSQILLRYFNQLTCTSITQDGSLCGYDIKNFKCQNKFLDANNKSIQNFKCTQFPMNIHLCLSYTQGSYCFYNTTTFQCSDYILTEPFQNCSTTNLNRDVCINSAFSCKYNKQKSKCEAFTYNNEKCTDLKATNDYLFGVVACTSVGNPKQTETKDYFKVCHAYQCDLQLYCTADPITQGCDILQYVFPQNEVIDGQQICTDVKKYLTCDKLYSQYTCLYLTDVPCYFDPIKKKCQDLDATNQNVAKCNLVSAAGCQQVLTKGEFCYLKTVQFQPVACNVGLPTYQICSYIVEAPPIPYYIQDVTYYYNYTQYQYYLNYNTQVNPNTCGQLQSTYAVYDEEIGQCTYEYYATGCDVPGMSKLLCDANSYQGCAYEPSLKYCYKKSASNSESCENTRLNATDFSDTSKINQQALQCPKNPNCAYILNSLLYSQTQIYNDYAACINCASTAQQTKTTDDSSCNDIFNSCSNVALTSATQCNGCQIQAEIKYNSSNASQVVPAYCSGDHTYFNVSCSCDKTKCLDASLSKYNTATQECTSSEACKKYINPCKTYTKTTNAASLIQNYQTMPKDLCLLSTGIAVGFDSQNYICNTLSSTQTKCSNLNYDSCVTLTNAKNLYCAWTNNQCRKINSYQFSSLTDCTQVNTNSCYSIKANCYKDISSSRCRSQTNLGSCADPNAIITSQFTCSQLESNQCYFKSDQEQCVQIVGNDYLYDCNMPGLNKKACLINTKQYCYYNKQCLQISDLANQECSGLNRKACIEHPILPCIWNYSSSTCSQVVYSSNPTCQNFQTTMPSSYLVNLITCLQIKNYPCVYLNNLCQIPQTQSGCTAQLYNKLGCTQSTNQLCQVKIGKTDESTGIIQQIYCQEIGDLNQGCSETLNQYACVKMVGCIWQSVCKDFVYVSDSDAQTKLDTYQISPQICQNIKGQPYIYNNYKCQIVASQIYDCTTPYINYETCIQFTRGYCIFKLPTVIKYTDTTQRCLNYDISQLNTQLCDQQLNFNVCSAVYNSACVFKQKKCQQFNKLEDTCVSLSQPGIYASVQSCVQTDDSFCSYDSVNQRCKVITSASSVICDQLGINQKLCLSITKLSNKCEFQTTSIIGTQLSNSICTFAKKEFYQCDSLVSMNQCVLIQNCKFQDYKCQLLQASDYTSCLKSYQVDGYSCSKATDIACGYDESNYTCIQNPTDDIKKIKYLNKLACVKSTLTESLIFLDNKCQLVKDAGIDISTLKCDQDLNQFACLNVDQSSDQLCIFTNKCEVSYNSKCLQNKNINNPQICQNTDDVPCKFLNNNCVNAQNIESECQSKGLNILACLQTNLLTCQACADIVLNSQCAQVDTQVLCLSLNHQCQWITSQSGQPCLSYDTSNKRCDQLPAGVNRNSCYSIDMNNLLDQECVYDTSTTKCKQQKLTSCQNLNSQVTCISNTLLSCIWLKNKCQASTPLISQDYCTTYLGSNEFCKAVKRFDAFCEFISGTCTEAKYQQENWDKYVNQKACIQQKLKNCYWKINSCICIQGEELLKQQQVLQCEQDLSYLMCLSITTQGQYCQFLYGRCNQLVLPQNFEWNRYALVNQNVCAQASGQYVGYNKIKFSCQILSKVDDCDYPGLNKQVCLSQILDQPCIWLNNKCQYQVGKGNSRLLQQNLGYINSAICYDSILAVYYDGVQCQQVDEFTKCDALGLSKAGCFAIKSESCRWLSDNDGCIKDYPYNRCEQNIGMVNAVFCQYVELGACKYDQKSNSCVSAFFDTWVYHYEKQICECVANYCDQSKIQDECVLPQTKGINDKACVQIQGALYVNHECSLVNPNSNCPKLVPVNPLACKYAIDECIYDSIDENCTSVNFGQSCEDPTISQVACQELQCTYFDNNCTCKALTQVLCLTYNQQVCEGNNLCYWEDQKCHINQCKGKTDNCETDSTQNCYRRMKNGKQICDYANTCEDIKFETSFYQGCTEIKINGVPCLSNQDKNSSSACSTLQCSNFKSQIDCIQTQNGMIKRSDHCVYINEKQLCSPIQCSDITIQDDCNKKIGCRYIQQINGIKKNCQEFKTCADVKNIVEIVEDVCNKMVELDYISKNYIPCSWTNEKCVNNPCQYLGIDEQICNGAHINNKYVCTLDKNSYTCNACEVYQKGCDCLQNDKYCKWDTNKQICQSIPCKDLQSQESCNRRDCQFSNVCFTKCQYHYNQQFCSENQCYWDSYSQKCAECDINFCDDSTCSNDKCCYNKKVVEFGESYFVCVPKCEKIVSSQCESKFCSWRVDYETCEDDYKSIEVSNENDNENNNQN